MRDSPPDLRAVLLDLDGTIVDAADGIIDAILIFAREQGLAEPTRAWLRAQIGKNPEDTWRQMGGHEPAAMSAIFSERYGPLIASRAKPTPGSEETLVWLAEAGIASIAVTTRTVDSAQRVLQAMGFDRYFKDVLGRDLVPEPKPSPAIVHLALERHHLLPTHSVMVGDTSADVLAARGAGVAAYGVLGGIGAEQELRDAGADFILANGIGELADVLNARARHKDIHS